MLKTLRAALVFCTPVFLAACATTTPSTSETVSPSLNNTATSLGLEKDGTSTLTISRVRTMPYKLKARISVDGQEVGRLKNGEYLSVSVPSGTREVKLHYNKLSLQKGDKIELDFEPDETYAFTIDSGFVGHTNIKYGNNISVDVKLVPVSSELAANCCELVPSKGFVTL